MIIGDALKPAVAWVKISEGGEPRLEGQCCAGCGEIYLEPRRACPRCHSRAPMAAKTLATTGRLYNYTVVHRSFPGVKTPYVSAIVDLDDGAVIKGNLIDVDPRPEALDFGMPVKVVFREADRTDDKGGRYLAYFFVPAET